MLTLDAQVHAYEKNTPERPWHAVLEGPEEVTGDQMVAAMDAVGVDGAVLVSPKTMYEYDASYALEVYARHPTKFCLVKPVDPSDPAVGDTIDDWKSTAGTVAIRIMLRGDVPEDATDPGINSVLRKAAAVGFPVNLACRDRLGQVAGLAAANPDTQLVVDHLGQTQPRHPPAPADAWKDLPKLLNVAQYPNVAVKVSGACTLAHDPFPYPDIWDPLGRVFDAFGFERLMWGTDWTRAINVLSYEQGVEAFRVTDRLTDGEREKLMGGTLQKVYNWSPVSG